MPSFDLRGTAGQFAAELSSLLNNTICTGIRITAVVAAPTHGVIGYNISRDNQDSTVGIPLTLGRKDPSGYLGLSYRLGPDDENEYLTITSSFMGFFVDPDLERPLMHYDYERNKAHGYPEAHLQVCAATPVWDEICERTDRLGRPLARVHFPVGPRRYRPTLEDVIEFLVVEGLVDAHDGWGEHVSTGREGFQRRQLRAAVRRDPESALAVLRDLGKA